MSSVDLIEAYRDGRRDFGGTEISALVGHHDLTFAECDFRSARFYAADVSGLTFSRCDFSDARIIESFLTLTHFVQCTADGLTFDNCNLYLLRIRDSSLLEMDIGTSKMFHGEFVRCDMRAAKMVGSRFHDVVFRQTRLDRAVLYQTILTKTVLDDFCAAGELTATDVTVDWGSLCRSLRATDLVEFLVRSGTPEIFAHYSVDCARALDPDLLFDMMTSTFISYGAGDAEFACLLRDELHKNGVRTFFFERDAVPGERLFQVMRQGVNQFDRIIVICSESALSRAGVRHEIEEALAREARDGGATYILPVAIDDYLFTADQALLNPLRDRVVADFRGALTDRRRFATALRKLLVALRRR